MTEININQATVCRHDRPTLLYFLFFPTALFFNSILASRTNGTFAFAPTVQTDPKGKSKRAIFCHGKLIRDIPKEVSEANNKVSRALQKDAIVNDNWQPYIEYQIAQGVTYAKMGLDFKSWLGTGEAN